MQLFSWKTEELELDNETWKHPVIERIQKLGMDTAIRMAPTQKNCGRKLMYQAAETEDAQTFINLLKDIAKEGEKAIMGDKEAFKNAIRGDIWWGSQRRHFCAQSYYAAWTQMGEQAADKASPELFDTCQEDRLERIMPFKTKERERVMRWEKGAILLLTHPGMLSGQWRTNAARTSAEVLQKQTERVLGKKETPQKSLLVLSSHAKRMLGLLGKSLILDPDISKMRWIWADLEGEAVETPIKGIEPQVDLQTEIKYGELILKGALQRSWIRQTIRQESYTLKAALVDKILKHGEERASQECPGKSDFFKTTMATRIVWDLFCRLEGQEILKND
jgi:hypothetical protein